jgi:hypothetical protein
MDRERAEIYLRLLAEAEFRRVLLSAEQPDSWRVRAVGKALTAVGAIDQSAADAIEKDLELAVTVRESDKRPFKIRGFRRLKPPSATQVPGQRPSIGIRAYSSTLTVTAIVAVSARQTVQPQTVPELIVPLGLLIPLETDDVSLELHLVTFVRTAADARFIMRARVTDAPDPAFALSRRTRPGFSLLKGLSLTDDNGTAYHLRFTGSSDDQGFTGQLRAIPALPPAVRWVELSQPDGPATRISLDRQAPGPETVTVTSTQNTAAELLLNDYAMRILSYDNEIPEAAVALGNVVQALLEAGALSTASPLPSQLARLCERLGLDEHGIPAPAARDDELPGQWLSEPQEPYTPFPPNQCAASVASLPELDGITMTLFGLINTGEQSLLCLHASGVTGGFRDNNMPGLWIRDDLGGWHATRSRGLHAHDNGAEGTLEIWPPLRHASAIEVIVTGRSAEVRATLPLNWR